MTNQPLHFQGLKIAIVRALVHIQAVPLLDQKPKIKDKLSRKAGLSLKVPRKMEVQVLRRAVLLAQRVKVVTAAVRMPDSYIYNLRGQFINYYIK